MGMFYTGIGSRNTPEAITDLMGDIAEQLGKSGWILRTGGATGADEAFLLRAVGKRLPYELYLPWKSYSSVDSTLSQPTDIAYQVSAKYHPTWGRLSQAGRALHARNAHCVLGKDCKTPSRFVLCYTPQANGTGGTGQGIRIAKAYHIPVFDLGDTEVVLRMQRFLQHIDMLS